MIRIKNIDFNSSGMKRSTQVRLGDISASVTPIIFIAPVACKIDSVAFAQQNKYSANTSNTLKFEPTLGTTALGNLIFNVSAASGIWSAGEYRVIIPTAANCMTQGAILVLNTSAVCQAQTSGVVCLVTYSPLKHRETK